MPLKTVWRDLFARYGPLETPKLLSTPISDNNNNLYLLSFLNNPGALVVLNSLWIFSRDLHFFSQYSPAICHPILHAHPTRPASSPAQLPPGIFSTKKVSPEGLAFHIAWVYRLPSGWGSHRWLRKGDSALTPWIAQKNAILHLTRIMPTKGSWPAWKQVCACPQPYWFCGFFCGPVRYRQPRPRGSGSCNLWRFVMNIVVNGQTEDCAPDASISRFLTERAYEASAVVVERNGQIIARDTFAQTTLQEGDCLEIVQFVGGG